MAVTRQTVVAKARNLVGKAAEVPGVMSLGTCADMAVADYTRFAQFDEVEWTITGDGGDEYDVPAGFIPAVAVIRKVSYWAANDTTTAPQIIEESGYQVEDDLPADGTAQLRLNFSPTSADRVVVTYTAPHTLTDSASTVPAAMEQGLACLAAAYLYDSAAGNTASQVPQATDADFIVPGFGTAGDAYRRLATKMEQRGDLYLGISREAVIERAGASVVVTKAVVPGKNAGRVYLTHGRHRPGTHGVG